MSRIFISYRRDDSEGYVGRIYDYLRQRFDEHDIFLDVQAIDAGADFPTDLKAEVNACQAFLAVIGPKWLKILRKRLSQPRDYVRLEIAAALKRDIPVIPVLVQRAKMPPAGKLPSDLAPLANRNYIEISHDRFVYDMNRLIETIGGAYGSVVVALEFDQRLFRSLLPGLRHGDYRIGRDPRTHEIVDMPRKHLFPIKVDIDGQQKTSLDDGGGQVAIKLKEGVHSIYVTKDNLRPSDPLRFRLKGGQTVKFWVNFEFATYIGEPIKLVLEQEEIL